MFQEVIDRLSMQSGESVETDNIMNHIVKRVTDEGLVVEFYDSNENTLFDNDNKPTPLLNVLLTATLVQQILWRTQSRLKPMWQARPSFWPINRSGVQPVNGPSWRAKA